MGIKVGVFFGGISVEHEISVISAIQAIRALDPAKYDVAPVYIAKDGAMYVGDSIGVIEEYRDIPALLKKSQRVVCLRDNDRICIMKYPFRRLGNPVYGTIDVAFPIVHGTNVEDGAFQGFLKTMGIPFVGSDVAASAAGMDKYITKAILRDVGVPVLDCMRVYVKAYYRDPQVIIEHLEQSVQYPMIVKPLNLGSSIGIKKAFDSDSLKAALEYAFQYANMILVEEAVPNLKEINCAVLGDQESSMASECEEPVNTDLILSYEDKYISGGKDGSKGMYSAKRKLPAEISHETRKLVRQLAQKTFQALGCNGVARIDFLMNEQSGEIWVNEINTIPGSLSFYLWEAAGLPYGQLLDRLIELALKRARENENISYSFDTNILSGFTLGGAKGTKNSAN